MKTKLLVIISLIFAYGNSQTTTTYDQRTAHYTNFSDGGGSFDQATVLFPVLDHIPTSSVA